MKAYGYLRVSGPGQRNGDGFARQQRAITEYAESKGIDVVQWFEETEHGTTHLSGRPAFQKLMVALHSDGVRLVLIERLDRLARDLMVQETVLADFRRYKFKMVSVLEPDLCQDDPSRKLMRQIFGAMAEYDRSMIVLKLRAGLARMRATGRREGRKPYPDPRRSQEQETYRKMKELHSSGVKYEHIATALNQDRIPTRSNGRWFAATVRKIILRERLAPGS